MTGLVQRAVAVPTAAAFGLMLVAAPATSSQVTIRLTELPADGAGLARDMAINDRGQIGATLTPDENVYATRIVRWDCGPSGYVLHPLSSPRPGARFAAINDRGDVLAEDGTLWDRRDQVVATVPPPGAYRVALNNRRQVLQFHDQEWPPGLPRTTGLWSRSGLAELKNPGHYVLPSGINNRGQVTGTVLAQLGTQNSGFVWNGRTLTKVQGPAGAPVNYMADINDRGQAVGLYQEQSRTFLYAHGRSTDIGTLGGSATVVHGPFGKAINERGQIAGLSTTASGTPRAFLWDRGKMTDLGPLGGDRSGWVKDVNDMGQVIGQSFTADGEVHPFLWDRGTMYDLHVPGARSTEALDINNRGQIVGTIFTQSRQERAVTWTATR
ncbi:DUF3466 family protein [Actinomadura rudentiformis]|uniref:DUF3466 family protein n=1 Tax=Actinomadura rudentiformis TaxID=359158 RepID=A0A6H9Z9S5_9ACTN|nr:DUF3466 family protein [Actinomadura rudentiformis]KAB2352183.1 DUF3466 family protein [Actinomadura rudentiformis]